MDDTKCKCGCGFDIQPRFRTVLDKINREMIVRTSKGLEFTSAARCKKHNASVGGKPNSSHPLGLAADVKYPDSHWLYEFMEVCYNMGIVRIGICLERGFVHIDIATPADGYPYAQRVIWKY
jgi:uncharacterized protein YcbK (DUF882 family)